MLAGALVGMMAMIMVWAAAPGGAGGEGGFDLLTHPGDVASYARTVLIGLISALALGVLELFSVNRKITLPLTAVAGVIVLAGAMMALIAINEIFLRDPGVGLYLAAAAGMALILVSAAGALGLLPEE